MVPAEDLFQEAPNRTFDGVLTCRFPGIMGILPLGLTGRVRAPHTIYSSLAPFPILSYQLCKNTVIDSSSSVACRCAIHRSVPSSVRSDAKVMIENCGETFSQIKLLIEKAKIETKVSSKGQITKCAKWLWSKKEVELLRAQLEQYKASVSLMIQALSGYKMSHR